MEKAAVKYEKAVECSKRCVPPANLNISFAYRALAEIALDETDGKVLRFRLLIDRLTPTSSSDPSSQRRAMKNIDAAMRFSVESGDVGQIQLISHQRAYIYLQCGELEKVRVCL